MSLKVSLAGRVSIGTDGVLIDEERFPGRQGRLVFAYLVSEHGRPVFRDELAEALWGETPPATWEKALGVIASKLRVLLGECGLDGATVLTNAFGCYRLELPEGSWVDLLAAAQGVDEAEAALAAGRPDKAKLEASRAASLARLALLPGEDGVWVERKRRELADVLCHALDCLADACLLSGDAEEAAKWAAEAIALEPFRESGYRRLMHAHAAAGNSAEALRAYDRCRRLLADELGAYPSPETESIYRELLSGAQLEARAAALPQAGVESAVTTTPDTVGVRRPSRRLIVTATCTALAVGAGLVAVLTQGGRSTAVTSMGANAVGLINAESGKITSQIPVGVAPTAVAGSRNAIWVTSADGNSISRIDPRTNNVRQTIDVGGGPAGVAVTRNGVWVANSLDGTVSRIDPRTNRVVQTIAVGNGPTGVASGENAVWVTNSVDGTVSRIDPDTGRVTRTLAAAIGASGVAVAFHRVWVVSPPSGSVVALDPRSGQVLQRIGVGVDPNAVAVGAGAVWVANRADGTISKFDPRAGAVTDTVQVGRAPDGIATGPAGIWVANRGGGTLSRIDPSSDAVVQTVRLDKPPQGLAATPHGVYVAVHSTGREHRGGTLKFLSSFSPGSIDPALQYGPSILILTNDGLVGFRRVGGVQGTQLVPDLAGSLPTPTDNGKTYTFQLRPGIRYSTGKLLRPGDFRRGIERVFEVSGDAGGYFGGIVGADRCVTGKSCDLSRGIVTGGAARTVTFHLTAPDADFLLRLALPIASPVPAGTPAHDVGTHPIAATGPYRIAAYRTKTHTLRLVRNRRFRQWSEDAQPGGYPDAISWSWRFGPDVSAQVRAVERGAADLAWGVSPPLSKEQLDLLATRYPSQLHVSTQARTNYFFLNTRVSPFDDVRVRRAVNAAFDRDAFSRLLGRAYAPTCQIVPPNFPGFRRTCPYLSGGVTGLDLARRLVGSSGTAGSRVNVWVPSTLAAQGRYMVSVLHSLGYRAHLRAVQLKPDVGTYYRKVLDSRVRAQVGYYGWAADFTSPRDFIYPFSCAAFVPSSPQRNSNPAAFCDRSIDAQIERASAVQVQAPPAATLLWQRIEREILAQSPVVPTSNVRAVDFVSRRVGNYKHNPQWGALLDQAWVR